ncbi:deoxyribodipyrimidine photo-lyase [Methylomonas paludis]|uniref:Deoxyribodipyrimidine photo-lyase n=1 Tax=Methylomonas paludis TaxID=1173101 RepID=A0A975MNX4_9GAMM|nr:deoxyribodipyrimidine photo-lyase [Methylomonas paludis]QWF71333.1 deoxyribodipyrimidine photo-lyase [Methylomonas paludis]
MFRYRLSAFIFRRDLRLADNRGLNAALAASEKVLLCFILDPRQIEPHPYQSLPGLQFMLEALADLQQQAHQLNGVLYLFNDQPEQVLSRLRQEQQIEAVFVNRDYTPFSRHRDADLQHYCRQAGLDFNSYADLLLNEPEQVLKDSRQPYQVFTPFYRRARQIPVALPQTVSTGKFVQHYPEYKEPDWLKQLQTSHHNPFRGGRSPALAILEHKVTECREYAVQRDIPALAATSGLSAYLKFGCCSVREAYYAIAQELGSEHGLLRQLYWRDFFSHIAFHYPHVFGHAFHRQYDAIPWQKDMDRFQAWSEGRTGFPIVDAAMRELRETGWMHNRLRMITASFLVKDLHISWRWGERYFAQQLIDYDPCINNGNWQWAASTGCDAQPYFRIFNPWLQQQKFDPDGVYIRRWLPELRDLSPKQIDQQRDGGLVGDYPGPMVEHGVQSEIIKGLFKAVQSS